MALSGPRLSPRKGAATELVVLVHGYGADGNDLIGLAEPLSQLLPGAAFVAPNAPQRCPGAGFMWFPISELTPHAMHGGVMAAAPALQTFVEKELAQLNLPISRLALIGFSQGTMLSLHLAVNGFKPAAVVGFSGVLTGEAKPADALPPIFLSHGTADQVIPVEALFMTAGALGAAGACVEWHLSPGIGHGIDEKALTLASAFLKQAFDGRLAAHGQASSRLP